MTRNKIVSGAAAVAAALLGAAGLAGALPEQANPTAGEHVPTTTTTAEVVETEGAENHGKSGENENDTVETESHDGGGEWPNPDASDIANYVHTFEPGERDGQLIADEARSTTGTANAQADPGSQADTAGTQAEDAGSQADDHRKDGEHRP